MEKIIKKHLLVILITLAVLLAILFFAFPEFLSGTASYVRNEEMNKEKKQTVPAMLPLNTVDYDKRMTELANNPPPAYKIIKDPQTGEDVRVYDSPGPGAGNRWPAETVYPNAGAILPFNRIIAYYGNLYSKSMGVLGEYPEAEMLQRLDVEVKKWEAADPGTPVLPALHYIAVVAQGSAGADGKYRSRMPDSEIDKVLKIAEKIDAIVFLDIQVGFSTIQSELPRLEKYLKLPNVHLGMDPEFSMKGDIRPGKVVGTFDAADFNYATDFLAKIVKENNLPPKVLVIHRYTQKMVTNYQVIKPLPEVQIVMHMDGWGPTAKKIGTYKNFIYPEPVQFAGFKLFYKNDVFDPGTVLMTPSDLLKLRPRPIYIQYQ